MLRLTKGWIHELWRCVLDTAQSVRRKRVRFSAARRVRRILVDHARRRTPGENAPQIEFRNDFAVSPQDAERVLALHQALTRLAKIEDRLARIVEFRLFADMSDNEIAELLGVPVRTVKRDWRLAKAWLFGELGQFHS